MTDKIRQDLIDKLFEGGKYKYGTPEYWKKERCSKFIINARQKEQKLKEFYKSIVNLWSLTAKIEMPLYNLLSKNI